MIRTVTAVIARLFPLLPCTTDDDDDAVVISPPVCRAFSPPNAAVTSPKLARNTRISRSRTISSRRTPATSACTQASSRVVVGTGGCDAFPVRASASYSGGCARRREGADGSCSFPSRARALLRGLHGYHTLRPRITRPASPTRVTPSHPSSVSALPRATAVRGLRRRRALLQTGSFVTMPFVIDAFGRGSGEGRGLVEGGRER